MMRSWTKFLFRLSFLHLLGVAIPASLLHSPADVHAASRAQNILYVFDWDATIMNLPSPIYIYDKTTGQERAISNAEFREAEHAVGKKDPWKNYEFIYDESSPKMSFRRARRSPVGQNYFADDIIAAFNTPHLRWKGPAWEEWVRQLSTPALAKNVMILTARGHTPQEMFEGIKILQQRGLIRHLPDLKNIVARNYAELPATQVSTHQFKARELQSIVQKNTTPSTKSTPLVLRFYDDTVENIYKTEEILNESRKSLDSLAKAKLEFHHVDDVLHVFDWDGTVMNIPSPTYLYERNTGREIVLSSQHFDQIEQELGRPGEWQNYQMVTDEQSPRYSFRRRRASPPGARYFEDDLRAGLETAEEIWKGPAWPEFVKQLEYPQSAKKMMILTARGHSPQEMMRGIRILHQRGLIKHLPELGNIITRNHKMFPTYSDSIHEFKADQLEKVLKRLERGLKKPGNVRRTIRFYEDIAENVYETQKTLQRRWQVGAWDHTRLEFNHVVRNQSHRLIVFDPCNLTKSLHSLIPSKP